MQELLSVHPSAHLHHGYTSQLPPLLWRLLDSSPFVLLRSSSCWSSSVGTLEFRGVIEPVRTARPGLNYIQAGATRSVAPFLAYAPHLWPTGSLKRSLPCGARAVWIPPTRWSPLRACTKKERQMKRFRFIPPARSNTTSLVRAVEWQSRALYEWAWAGPVCARCLRVAGSHFCVAA